jgi:hypothetical protein
MHTTVMSILRRLRPTAADLAAVVALQDPRPLLELRRHLVR